MAEQEQEDVLPTKAEIEAQLSGTKDQGPAEESEVSYEEAAAAEGWVPQDEWEGDPHKWVPADEFMRRKPLFEKISSQSKQMKKLREELDAFASHHKKVFEASYKKALADLERQRDLAEDDGDSRAVREIEKEIKSVEKEFEEESKQLTVNKGPSMFEEWVKENSWYQENPGLRADADALGVRYANSNPGASEEEIFAYVDERMRPVIEGRSGKSKTSRPVAAAVEGNAASKRSPGRKTVELSPEEKQVMNALVRGGHMTKEEYMAELAKMKD
jgi:hypothetical protein